MLSSCNLQPWSRATTATPGGGCQQVGAHSGCLCRQPSRGGALSWLQQSASEREYVIGRNKSEPPPPITLLGLCVWKSGPPRSKWWLRHGAILRSPSKKPRPNRRPPLYMMQQPHCYFRSNHHHHHAPSGGGRRNARLLVRAHLRKT